MYAAQCLIDSMHNMHHRWQPLSGASTLLSHQGWNVAFEGNVSHKVPPMFVIATVELTGLS